MNRLTTPASTSLQKRVLTIREAAERLGVSYQTAINIFEKEPGTIIIPRPETLHKRRYRSIRIPLAVFERVLRRFTV